MLSLACLYWRNPSRKFARGFPYRSRLERKKVNTGLFYGNEDYLLECSMSLWWFFIESLSFQHSKSSLVYYLKHKYFRQALIWCIMRFYKPIQIFPQNAKLPWHLVWRHVVLNKQLCGCRGWTIKTPFDSFIFIPSKERIEKK